MPNRIIREGWLESEHINELKPEEECFFIRLCLRADDYGRFHANPLLLRSNLFPLRENVRSTDIPRWLAACQKAGLVRCYEADAKPFLEILKFGQRTRAHVSKFPPPPDIGGQMTDTRQTHDRQPRTETETETEAIAPPEPGAPAAPPAQTLTLLPSPAPEPPPRARNPLLDALVAATGSDPRQVTPSAWPGIAKALAEIRSVCPTLDSAELHRRAAHYRAHMAGAACTPHALAKHWALCNEPPQRTEAPRGAALFA